MDELYQTKEFQQQLKEKEIKMITVSDSDYPQKLQMIPKKPEVLFYKGKLPDEKKPIVALVGARACSNYGRAMAKEIGMGLSEAGIQVISGMARGIDTYSQLGAFSGKTETFSVLGCGVDICYPTENIELYQDIISKGGVISEYPPGEKPLAWHFPQRNRIISGFADLVIVVEAKENSGSLITVEWALEQGKDVMAVPGRIGERLSSGCNRLIKSGAGIVTEVKDILEELQYNGGSVFTDQKSENIIDDSKMLCIYQNLTVEPQNIQMIVDITKLDYEIVVEKLLQLQLMEMVEQPAQGYYVKK